MNQKKEEVDNKISFVVNMKLIFLMFFKKIKRYDIIIIESDII